MRPRNCFLAFLLLLPSTTVLSRSASGQDERQSLARVWHDSVETAFGGTPPGSIQRATAPSIVPGPALAEWMFPYETSVDDQAEECARTLIAIGYVRSTSSDPAWAEFFRGRMARYLSEILVNGPHRDDMEESLAKNGCQAWIDSFGEMTPDAFPFQGGPTAAGIAGFKYLEVVTTLDLGYLRGKENSLETVPVPVFLLPLYERYLIQHEFGHVHRFHLDGTAMIGDRTLQEASKALYENARTEGVFASHYAAVNEHEYWAEATAIYFSPIPIAALNSGPGNGEEGVGLTPEAQAIVLRNGFFRLTGAELLALLQPELYSALVEFYGPPLVFSLVGGFGTEAVERLLAEKGRAWLPSTRAPRGRSR
ncbi:MAG: hypothetical protein HY720_10975 [Planctomycetes bacterium]|nr:hypothetical protein [Planctomycetota bacterium]